MKEITIKKYEANDGMLFDSKEACLMHEEKKKCYDELVKKVPHCISCHIDMFPSGGGDSYSIYFKCRSKEEAQIVLSWCEAHGIDTEVSESQMVGNIVVLPDVYGYPCFDSINCNYVYCSLISLSHWIGNIVRAVGFVQYKEWETE